MSPEEINAAFIRDGIHKNAYDLLKFAESYGMSDEDFTMYLKAKGYKPPAIATLAASYRNWYKQSSKL